MLSLYGLIYTSLSAALKATPLLLIILNLRLKGYKLILGNINILAEAPANKEAVYRSPPALSLTFVPSLVTTLKETDPPVDGVIDPSLTVTDAYNSKFEELSYVKTIVSKPLAKLSSSVVTKLALNAAGVEYLAVDILTPPQAYQPTYRSLN
jgi:hypothetical protein